MSRLQNKLENKTETKKIQGVYLMSGYPDKETFLELMNLCSQNGADFLEIGMPFSDPSADSTIVQQAGCKALQNRITVKQTIEYIKSFRKNDEKTPIVWVGYFNSLYKYGIESFLKDFGTAGGDGILIYDLPLEEYHRIKDIQDMNIDLISVIASVTSHERCRTIVKNASGFLYYLLNRPSVDDDMRKIEDVKQITNLPVLASNAVFANNKDGVVVDSEIIEIISKNIDDKTKMFNEIKKFIEHL